MIDACRIEELEARVDAVDSLEEQLEDIARRTSDLEHKVNRLGVLLWEMANILEGRQILTIELPKDR